MIVQTKYGLVNGVAEGGFEVFKNIPFATPPVGTLRFKPPQPPELWEGVRDATAFGPRAMQDPANPDNAGAEMSEADCLNLNVWTPAADGGKRPVVVHVHGGGYCFGWNSESCFDAQHFVKDRDIVFVAIQYRLGALGYLYLGDLLGEEYISSGSCGTLDQIAALRWVHENIAAFGGDPNNVTVMGESAGGRSVAAMITTPAAKGLFQKAILQSGAIQSIRDRRTAAQIALQILAELGIAPANAIQILTAPAERIVEAQQKVMGKLGAHMCGSVIDGVNMFVSPEEYIRAGNLKDVPMLIGANRDEMRFPVPDSMFSEEYIKASFEKFGLNAPYVEAKYRERARVMGEKEALADIQTEYVYGNPAPVFAALLSEAGGKAWLYRWDHDKNTFPLAHHFSEMAYIFDFASVEYQKGYPDTEENRNVAAMMNEIWNSFILHGDPNIAGLPQWEPYCNSAKGMRMYLKADPESKPFDLETDCDRTMPVQVIRY